MKTSTLNPAMSEQQIYADYQSRKMKAGSWFPISSAELNALGAQGAIFLNALLNFANNGHTSPDGWVPFTPALAMRLTGIGHAAQEMMLLKLHRKGVIEVDDGKDRRIRVNIDKLEKVVKNTN